MRLARFAATVFAAAGLFAATPQIGAAADQAMMWPSERDALVRELDSRASELRRQMHHAGVSGDYVTYERLRSEMQSVNQRKQAILEQSGQI